MIIWRITGDIDVDSGNVFCEVSLGDSPIVYGGYIEPGAMCTLPSAAETIEMIREGTLGPMNDLTIRRRKASCQSPELVGHILIGQIIEGNLAHAECAENLSHNCVIVWSANAAEQIGELVNELSKGEHE